MPWTYNDYPNSLKNLTAEVRRKAIDIANALLDQGHEEEAAIAIATASGLKTETNPSRSDCRPNFSA